MRAADSREREMTAIYLGASRATSNLDIVCDMRTPDVLDSALKKKLLIKGELFGVQAGLGQGETL